MFAATGNRVAALHRARIGGLHLPANLAPGAFERADERRIAAIFQPVTHL